MFQPVSFYFTCLLLFDLVLDLVTVKWWQFVVGQVIETFENTPTFSLYLPGYSVREFIIHFRKFSTLYRSRSQAVERILSVNLPFFCM